MKKKIKAQKTSKKTGKRKCTIFYLIAGTLFLIGAMRFYILKDITGSIINTLAGLAFLLISYLNKG